MTTNRMRNRAALLAPASAAAAAATQAELDAFEAAVPSTYVAQTQESIWFAPSTFQAAAGSPALGTVASRYTAYLLDAASDESIRRNIILPSYVENVLVELYWTNAGAGSGNVVIAYVVDGAAEGETLAASGAVVPTTTMPPAVAPAQDVLEITTLFSTAVDPADTFNLRLTRDADHINDTLANDIGIIGVKLTPF